LPKAVDVDQKRSELVEATWRVIVAEGFGAATLRRVASEARCTTGALTKYFSSREALFTEALRAANRSGRARMRAAVSRADSPAKRIEAIVLEALPLDAERLRAWQTRLAFWGAASESTALRDENARRFKAWRTYLDEYLAPIVPRPAARRDEVELLAGLVDGFALRLVLQSGGADRTDDDASEIVAAVRFHLRALQERYT
jgi:AcrR family transcriptional regulator